MPHFHLTSHGEPRYVVRIADCTRDHAESVLRNIRSAEGCPDDLTLTEVDGLYDDPVHVPWWKRRIGA